MLHPPPMVSFYREARDGAQQIGFLAVARQDARSPGRRGSRACWRARSSPSSDTNVALPARASLPVALARRGLVAAVVDQVVGDLEGEADVARIAAIGRARLGRQLGHDARRLDRIFDQRAGLELLQPGDRGQVELLAFGGEVHHLPAGHARRADRARQLEHQVGAHPGVVVGRRMGEDFERQRVQAVAGEHGLGLAERLVDGRLAAPQVGVVHARQIVVDQRIDVDRLDRAADPKRALAGRSRTAATRRW